MKSNVVKKVSSSDTELKETLQRMGGSSSKQCGDISNENEKLKNRIKLYESGITDASLHAS